MVPPNPLLPNKNYLYTIEELKWDILILLWRGIGNVADASASANLLRKSLGFSDSNDLK